MAAIVKKGDSYYVVYRLRGKQKWDRAGRKKKDAERVKAQREYEILSGSLREIKKIRFSEFADRWLADYARISVKGSTLESYESIIRTHLTPFFGGGELRSIETADCQTLVATRLRDEQLSPKTVAHIIVVLKGMLKHAVRWGYLNANPAQCVELPRMVDKEMDFLKPDEIRLFLDHASPAYRTLFLTAVLTGMRRGELLGLRWEDVDFPHSTIHVQRALWKRELVTPKSRRSVRAIVMSPEIVNALRQHRLANEGSDGDFVFTNGKGMPVDGQNLVHREFMPALKRAGLRRIRFHDLRHTFAALLISLGENVKFIQSQLGHASIQVTLDRYGHLMPEVGRGVGERLDQMVFGSVTRPPVRRMLEEVRSEASPAKKEALEPVEAQGLLCSGGWI